MTPGPGRRHVAADVEVTGDQARFLIVNADDFGQSKG